MRGSWALVLPLLLASCLELEQEVVIRKDGAGTQTLRLDLPKALLERLSRQSAVVRPLVPASQRDIEAIFSSRRTSAELAAAGMELSDYHLRDSRSRRGVSLTAKFDSIKELAHSPLLGGRADWVIKPAGKGLARLFFYPMGKQAWIDAQLRIRQYKRQPKDAKVQAWFVKQRAALGGLRLRFKIRLPGRALRADNRWGRLVRGEDPHEVVAEIRAADIARPEDLLRLLAPCFIVVFDARGCSLR